MEFAKRAWVQIRQQTEGLPKQAWMLLIAGCVVLVLVLWLITLYSGESARQPIAGFYDPADQAQVEQALISSGIDAQMEAGVLTVPKSQHAQARSVMLNAGLLASDTSSAFRDMFAEESPWLTPQQSKERLMEALRIELTRDLEDLDGVRTARVKIGTPTNERFGSRNLKASASVILSTDGTRSAKSLAAVVSQYVAGSMAELSPGAVAVTIDGRVQRLPSADDVNMAEWNDAKLAIEQETRDKVYDLLKHIEGVTVQASVMLGRELNESRVNSIYEPGTVTEEEKSSLVTNEPINQAEPGIQANTGANIGGGGAQVVATQEQTESKTTFSQPLVSGTSKQEIAGSPVRQVDVSIMVPRSYYVALWKLNNPESEESPTAEDLAALHDQEQATITSIVTPLTRAETATADGEVQQYLPGDVTVGMYADAQALGLVPQTASMGLLDMATSQTGTFLTAIILGLGGLGVLGLGLKKATAQQELPNYEELAGVPVSLPTEDDLIGEVEEGESEMAGVAVDAASIESIQMAEQITELIRGNPHEASQLLNKWVYEDEY